MRSLFVLMTLFLSWQVYAIPCDCEVRVHSPLTGSHQISPFVLKTYQLEEFSSYAAKNVHQCRQSCLAEFQMDMPSDRLSALLITYGQDLIGKKLLGYNCTGLTTLKFPVRVRARLGTKGLGNLVDLIQVINHEQICF
jgi:hypothetical protein